MDPRALHELVEALDAARRGDFSVRLTKRRKGVMGEVAASYNDLVEQNQRMSKELVRIAKIIGREGRMTERASLPGAAGGWETSIASLNSLIDDLVRPTTEVGRVLMAVADGDLSQKMALTIEGQPVKGEFLRIGTTVNTMVEQLSSFADEVTRVAREVGTEGKLGGQAEVKGVSGTWRDLTENVNLMATQPHRPGAKHHRGHDGGGPGRPHPADHGGREGRGARAEEHGEHDGRAAVVVRGRGHARGARGGHGGQARRSGRGEGRVGHLARPDREREPDGRQPDRPGARHRRRDDRRGQRRPLAEDHGGGKGRGGALADTINSMVDTLGVFAEQVTTVAREVGTEGKLGGQAEVPGVAGTWKDLTDSVNFMAGNLTSQVRNIAQITTAVANGDLSQKITVEAKGEVAALADTINSMVDTLRVFAEQVTTMAREVGTEGKLGGQAAVPGAAGTWRDLTDSVNFMARNLTDQVRNIIEVTTAVAKGDLTREITVDAKGEILELKRTVNTMVDQLSSFADEVTRVAREVGTEGALGGQAEVKGVSGTWRDLTDNVNFMAGNLTDQVRNIADVTTAVANGDLSKKITVDAKGEILELKDTINTMVDQLRAFAAEVTRVAKEVGTEGKLGGQAEVEGVSGTWRGLTENVNQLAGNLTTQVRNIAQVTTAVANGDLSKKITVEAKGEVAELADTINTMVDQLSSFADEVTRVAREVGTEGKLGGQAEVKGVSGTWRDLTDNVNMMASNLTDQVRNIAEVTTAVANGDLTREITVDAKGEILELKRTINTMVDQLSSFAAEVTRVAKEVGTEGKLGGQAEVRGRVRHVARPDREREPAGRQPDDPGARDRRGLHRGDPGRPDALDRRRGPGRGGGAQGQHQRDDRQPARHHEGERGAGLAEDQPRAHLGPDAGAARPEDGVLADHVRADAHGVGAARGVLPRRVAADERRRADLRLIASYGYRAARRRPPFALRRGARGPGGARAGEHPHHRATEDYIKISSGLGEAAPANIIVLPVVFEEHVLAVIELASFRPFSDVHLQFLEQLTETIGVSLNTIIANMRTEELLEQSQSLTQELQQPGTAGGAAADQRGAAGEGGAAQPAEPRHRGQEPRDRDRAAQPRGEGGAARAVLEVQVGVPGEHVARAAHAAQLAADPLEAAGGQRGPQPQREAGRVRRHDPLGRQRPALADQRHPRPVEGGGRQDGGAPGAGRPRRRAGLRGARVQAGGGGEGPGVRGGGRRGPAARPSRPTSSGCSRC